MVDESDRERVDDGLRHLGKGDIFQERGDDQGSDGADSGEGDIEESLVSISVFGSEFGRGSREEDPNAIPVSECAD